MKNNKNEHELSRVVKAEKIARGGIEERIVARDQEREGLAKRFKLQDLSRLEAILNVDHARDGMFAVMGNFRADVVMTCVVTLEPVPLTIMEPIDVLFAPPNRIGRPEDMTELGDLEEPEPLEDGMIDMGELVAQHLAMAMPLYPRKEGVAFESQEFEANEPRGNNPFMQLKKALENDNKSKG